MLPSITDTAIGKLVVAPVEAACRAVPLLEGAAAVVVEGHTEFLSSSCLLPELVVCLWRLSELARRSSRRRTSSHLAIVNGEHQTSCP